MKKWIAALLLVLITGPAYPWGGQGHRLIGLIAMDHLTPMARRNVKALLGAETLADVASWPDAYRPLETQTGTWHYVDIPAGSTTYDRDRDCPPQPGVKLDAPNDKWRDCVVDRILFFEDRLADAKLDDADRATALKYLVHFVGDIHQPLHAYGVERGGNGIGVVEFGSTTCGKYPCNLHSVWDGGLIGHRNLTDAQYQTVLEKQIKQASPAVTPDDPAAWANESRAAVDTLILPNGGAVDEAYYQRELPLVDQRLEQAGLRLAAVLNRIFTTPPVKFKPAAVDTRE